MKLTDICEMMAAMVMAIAVSCAPSRSAEGDADTIRADAPKEDMTPAAAYWADSVSASMDTLELASQTILPTVFASDDEWTVKRVVDYARKGIGGIILLRGNAGGAKVLSDSMQTIGKIIPIVAIDAEWGLGMRLEDAPVFPANGRLPADVDEQLMYDYGYEVARECRQIGINMVLGPVLDINGESGILGKRSYGANPDRVTDLGLAYGRGLEDGGVVSVAKHFPGQGSVGTDTHTGKGIVDRSLHVMDSIDLQPFKKWCMAGLSGIMVGHLAVSSIDGKMLPAAVSPVVIKDLLIDDLGFRGLVLTDAMNMGGAEGYGADKALKAGAHLIVAPRDSQEEISRIVNSVRNGEMQLELLRDRVRHILFYKYLMSVRIPDDNSRGLDTTYADSLRVRLEGK